MNEHADCSRLRLLYNSLFNGLFQIIKKRSHMILSRSVDFERADMANQFRHTVGLARGDSCCAPPYKHPGSQLRTPAQPLIHDSTLVRQCSALDKKQPHAPIHEQANLPREGVKTCSKPARGMRHFLMPFFGEGVKRNESYHQQQPQAKKLISFPG